jgi:2-oxoglutarate ferredoxin oxidoreductase subunit delta
MMFIITQTNMRLQNTDMTIIMQRYDDAAVRKDLFWRNLQQFRFQQMFICTCLYSLQKNRTMEDNISNSKPVKERKVKGKVEIDIQRCKGCELCTEACKEQAIKLSDTINIKGYRYIIANNDVCTGCVNCALVCPDAVITVYRTNPKKKAIDITQEQIKEQLQQVLVSSK